MRFLTPQGATDLTVRGSRPASRIAKYWAAVDRYMKTGRTDALRRFQGASFRAEKVKHFFVTDTRTLKRLGYAGEVAFEDLYADRF